MIRYHHIRSIYLALITTVLSIGISRAQSDTESVLEMTFSSDTIIQQRVSFSFNSLKIINRSADEVSFVPELNYSASFRALREYKDTITLAPGEKIILPVRLTGTGSEEGGRSYAVKALIRNEEGVKIKETEYILIPEKITDWIVASEKKNVFFNPEGKKLTFDIRLTNRGNTQEILTPKFDLPAAFGLINSPDTVILPPGADTLLRVGLSFDKKRQTGPGRNEIPVRFSGKTKNMILQQKLFPLSGTVRENNSRWYNAGVTLDFYTQQLGRKNPFFFSNITAGVSLNKGKRILFTSRSRLQANVPSAVGDHLFNLEYRSKNLTVRGGDITMLYDRIIQGVGGMINYRKERHEFEFVAVENRFKSAFNTAGKYTYRVSDKQRVTFRSNYENDKTRGITTDIYSVEYEQRFSSKTRLLLKTGFGNEIVETERSGGRIKNSGHSGKVLFDTETKKHLLRTEAEVSSGFYPGLARGAVIARGLYNYRFGKWYTGPSYRKTKSNSQFIRDSLEASAFNFNSDAVDWEIGRRGKSFNFKIGPSYIRERQDTILMNSYGFRIASGLRFGKTSSIQLRGYLSANKFRELDTDAFLRYNINMNITSKYIGLNTYYRKGPFFLGEFRRYAAEEVIREEFVVVPFVQKYFLSGKLYGRLEWQNSMDYGGLKRHVIRNNWRWQLSKGFAVRLEGLYNSSFAKDRFYVNTGINKRFNAPLVGISRFKKMTIVLFKDVDADGQFGKQDEPVTDAVVKIGSVYLQTDKNGRAVYKNIKPGTYNLDLTSVTAGKDWYPLYGSRTDIILSKSGTKYIPYVEGRRIFGRIDIEKSRFSDYNYSVRSIRITATDEAGRSYSGFTDEEGSFDFSIPPGRYNVTFNKGIFNSTKFNLLNSEVDIDIIDADSAEVIFKVKEQGRKMNIRKE